MTAKHAKPGRPIGKNTPLAAVGACPDGDAEKTYFRVRTAAAGLDTLGTPADPPPSGADAPPVAEPGLLGRLLGTAPRPARPPRRRTPSAVESPPVATAAPATVEGQVVAPAQEPAGPDEAVDSYRSASDLTAPDEIPQSDVVA